MAENHEWMPQEPLTPELALVDPDLAARARAALPDRPRTYAPQPAAAVRHATAPAPVPSPAEHDRTRYPLWARVTAVLWVLVIGILIGGAAIPHAADRPTLVPPAQDAAFCERPREEPPTQTIPLGPIGNPGRR